MKYKLYLRKEEKDDIVSVACLQGLLGRRIDDWAKHRPDEKELIKSAKLARTYTKKVLSILFAQIHRDVVPSMLEYSEKKQIMILDSNDAQLVRDREAEALKFISIPTEEFTRLHEIIKVNVCATCIGMKSDCFWQSLFVKYGDFEGMPKCENDRCPFSE